MAKTDLETTWLSLGGDLKTRGQKGQARRLLDIRSDKVFLFASNENGPLHIGIAFGPIQNPEGIRGSIPACQNLSVWLGQEDSPELYVMLTNDAYRNVFGGLCSFIIDHCESRPAGKAIGDAVVSQLNEWKYFLENRDPEGLSPELQRGLWGELTFLSDVLLPGLPKRDAIVAWTGPDRKARDFSFFNGAAEIKTTTAKKHHKIEISNEKQLDTKDLNFLYLIHFNLQDDGKNRISLRDKVSSVRALLADQPDALYLFESKLRNYGYLDIHDEKYQTGYRIAEAGYYIVNDQFPKIITDDVPPGVGDLTYSVIISSCAACLRDEGSAIKDMGLNNG